MDGIGRREGIDAAFIDGGRILQAEADQHDAVLEIIRRQQVLRVERLIVRDGGIAAGRAEGLDEAAGRQGLGATPATLVSMAAKPSS